MNDERGAALIEATVVTPFLIVLGFGIFEFGNVLYQHHMISTGVRDAARYLARVPAVDLPAYESNAQQIAVTGEVSGGNKRIAWWNASDVQISYRFVANPWDPVTEETVYRGPTPQLRIIQVSTSISYNGIGFLDLLGLGSSLALSMTHEERHLGN